MKKIELQTTVSKTLSGHRLDRLLSTLLTDYSRACIQSWIKSGHILVNGKKSQQKNTLNEGDIIVVNAKLNEIISQQPEDIPLDLIYEDEALIVINKPAGLIVHPGSGNPEHTLVNALLHYDTNLKQLPRAGIIHRLDKNTSGAMVIARTLAAQRFLTRQLRQRNIKREYQAIVCGQIIAGDTIETYLNRHPNNKIKMAVSQQGKKAVTHFRVIKRFGHYTHIRVNLETGRTHQIRVHMAHIRHPLIGDSVYGKTNSSMKGITPKLREIVSGFKRQALHACLLRLRHPVTQEMKTIEAGIPEDIKTLLKNLDRYDP